MVRQLYDMQQGIRKGVWSDLMKPVVAKLTNDDMLAIAATRRQSKKLEGKRQSEGDFESSLFRLLPFAFQLLYRSPSAAVGTGLVDDLSPFLTASSSARAALRMFSIARFPS